MATFMARQEILKYSVVRACARLENAKSRRDEDLDAESDRALKQAANLKLDCDEIGDE